MVESKNTAPTQVGDTVGATEQVYKSWPGKNRFCCGGRVMCGPGLSEVTLTVVLITLPTSCFLSTTAIEFMDLQKTYVPLILVGGFYVLTLVSLFMTAFRDPGVIPRQYGNDEEPSRKTYRRRPPRLQGVLTNGASAALRYCDTCKLYRPPRAIHCSICDNCVEVFDHHCPWVGTCIAKRNYASFISFLVTINALAISMIVLSISNMIFITHDIEKERGLKQADAFSKMFSASPMSLLVPIYAFLGMFFVGGLLGFHTYLLFTGQTTNEELKNSFFGQGSPYNYGFMRNCARLLCSTVAQREPYEFDKLGDVENTLSSIEGTVEMLDGDAFKALLQTDTKTNENKVFKDGKQLLRTASPEAKKQLSTNDGGSHETVDDTNGFAYRPPVNDSDDDPLEGEDATLNIHFDDE